ncbi:MFS general substrate transporter [Gloeophyllum trabeum ATCC 11539]|uniref:MFS general substrate transporter n=1 Tax=Gloeophyllum trabeum (strain ATCC 11539 / FP-39264 / Madison 617) TaxID=670483 RepID=S7Q3C3_GLOTA|nr:MFS general substrate transporter [Gloeophyllum trabeum ATCC 11539]EPQ54037.1 MFS general substrate transporter [Gloeophyllum trabeum ATCC 11539]
MGATGAILPYVEKAYGLNYAQVSALFICQFIGYIGAAFSVGPVSRRIGHGPTLILAVTLGIVGSVLNAAQQVSFVPMCLGFLLFGFGFAAELSLFNAYFALLSKPLIYTGFLHGVFGLGAFASPLVATAMVTRGAPYHFFYMTCLGMSVPTLALAWFSFRKLRSLPQRPADIISTGQRHGLREALNSRAVWTLALFMMFYVGAEESIGGWIVSFVLNVRHGSPHSASWVASSFYLGIAIGRMVLPSLNVVMGERRAVFIYLSLAIALEAVGWAVPIYSSTAVATALVGVAISTFYTAGIVMGSYLIPSRLHADAFSLMSSIGQSGSAFFPLIIGIIATKKGIWVVEPFVVALFCASGVMWFLAPRKTLN